MEWKIDHGTAVRTIYGASIALWLFGAVAFVLWFCRLAYVDDGLEVLPPAGSWARAILFTAAILRRLRSR